MHANKSALAQPVGDASADAPRITLRYAASSLDSAAGTEALYRRIVAAAEQVCPDTGGDPLHFNAAVRACRAQAVARAVQGIGNPRLAALHEAHLKQG